MINLKIRRVVNNRFSKKQDRQFLQSGVIGDYSGAIHVPGKTNYVYVRFGSIVSEVYNVRITPSFGLPVMVGYDPSDPMRQQILSARTREAEQSNADVFPVGFPPSIRYQWMAPGGGQDPLMMHLRAMLYLRISPAGGLYISIQPGLVRINGADVPVDYETFDLSSYVPTNAGKAILLLVTLDDTGDVVFTAGTEVDITSLTNFSSAPAAPSGTYLRLAYIRLYYGQVLIREDRTNGDITDLRIPLMINRFDAGSLSHLDEKAAPASTDYLLLQDNDDNGKIKYVQISNLPGGAGSWNITDGSNTVNNVTSVTVSGATVGGSAGAATLTITGGSGGATDVLQTQVFN